MFRHINDQRPCRGMEGPIALIMTPTRELAVQIHKEIKFFTKVLNIRSICCYGGSPIGEQIADLKRGAEIVVCTPGRMIDLLCANGGRVTNLRRVTYLVLDEADRMFDMGFEPQVMKIMYNIRKDRQSLLFSATFPKTMEGLARKILWKPIEIIVGARSVVAKDVTQIVEIYPDEDSKFLRLLEILGRTASEDEYAKTLIFVDRQDAADAMLTNLMRRGYPCSSIHGGKDQSDRDQTILDFKLGNTSILIATSVAARGLDVKDLKNVVNFECPNHLEDYVHRCGRTGRAGHKGVAYTFLTPDQDKYAEDIVKALTQSGTPIPFDLRELVENYEAKVRAGQVVSSGSGYGGKGLAHLEFQREVLKIVQKKSHGHDDDQDDQEAMRDADNDAPIDEPGNMQMISMKFNSLKDKAQALVRERSLAQQVQHGRSSAEANFYAEVEINDYPQQARFKVTSKEYIQKICELSGSAITVRGAFVQAGQKPQFNEPKLHLVFFCLI